MIVAGPGEGRSILGSAGITLKATAEQTGGSIGFFEATSEPGFAAPRHIHYSTDELFYVLSGEFPGSFHQMEAAERTRATASGGRPA
jgi:mannose-6-phosphate isomerase-like protein (cupin superfamily)